MVTEPQPHRISVEEYDQMTSAGIYGEDDPIELLDGELIEMPSQALPHISAVRRLIGLVHRAGVELGTVLVQLPLLVDDYSKPEPDLVVLRPPASQYDRRHPQASDVLLLIEVSDTSRTYDRQRKLPRYAAATIPEVWLVDLQDEVLLVYREPAEAAYGLTQIVRRGETIQAQLVMGLRTSVDEILGPAAG